jgi:hypothetical protein
LHFRCLCTNLANTTNLKDVMDPLKKMRYVDEARTWALCDHQAQYEGKTLGNGADSNKDGNWYNGEIPPVRTLGACGLTPNIYIHSSRPSWCWPRSPADAKGWQSTLEGNLGAPVPPDLQSHQWSLSRCKNPINMVPKQCNGSFEGQLRYIPNINNLCPQAAYLCKWEKFRNTYFNHSFGGCYLINPRHRD